jgi:hypothetical protein
LNGVVDVPRRADQIPETVIVTTLRASCGGHHPIMIAPTGRATGRTAIAGRDRLNGENSRTKVQNVMALSTDHNPYVFTNWLCGGGVRGGVSYGPSDQWGYKPLDRSRPTLVYDLHATVLRLLGLEHTKLTWRHNGIDRRLTDVHGRVIEELIA